MKKKSAIVFESVELKAEASSVDLERTAWGKLNKWQSGPDSQRIFTQFLIILFEAQPTERTTNNAQPTQL